MDKEEEEVAGDGLLDVPATCVSRTEEKKKNVEEEKGQEEE